MFEILNLTSEKGSHFTETDNYHLSVNQPVNVKRKMQFTRLGVMLLAAVASLAVSVDGFAPALSRLPKISSHSPYVNKLQNLYNRNVARQRRRRAAGGVPAASMESMDIPSTAEPRKTLNRVQSSLVKVLMIAYIASMCIALPL